MAIGFEELRIYFKIAGVIFGIWALILVFQGFRHFSTQEERRTWLLLLYAVFMFFLAKVFDGIGLFFHDFLDENFFPVMTMIIEGVFFAIIFYVVYLEIRSTGKLPIFFRVKPEANKGELDKIRMEPGHSYIAEEHDTDQVYQMVYEMVTHGHEGLIFTREFPERLRSKYGFKETPIIWLSREGKEENLRPTDLERLNHGVQDFLKRSKNGLIIIDGFEYLSTYNGFNKLVKLLHDLRDSCAINDAALLVVVHPGTITKQEVNYLKRDLITLTFGD